MSGGHSHHHQDHEHDATGRGLWASLGLTLVFALVEAGTGLFAHSLALLSDAGHMLSDTLALALSLFAVWMGRRPPSARHSYGFARTEIIAAFVNGLVLIAVVTAIVVEAIRRLQHPEPVAGGAVMIVAALGIVINGGVVYALSQEKRTLNTKSAILHVLGDLLGSAAALVAGSVIYFTGWLPIDPILSLVISGLILYSTVQLLRETLNVLMEGVPRHLDLRTVGRALAEVSGAVSVHDLHIWTLSSGTLALSAHVVVDDLAHWNGFLEVTQGLLHDRFDIDHVTLQPELMDVSHARGRPVIPIHPRA
ncbi:MAG: cation diffusion facilitator family transporter [Acidiferrobacter sp.]